MNSTTLASIYRKSLSFLGLALLAASPLRADLNSDIAFTAFSNVDINALAGGQILQARGGLVSFQRGITAQALYVLDATPEQVQEKLLHWNPASHPELKVWMQKELPAKPTAADFSGLASLPDNSSVNWLINATAKPDSSLQFDKNEMQLNDTLRSKGGDKKALFVNFWSQVLAGRASHFLSGNAASDTYVISGGDIQSISELKSLFHVYPKVYQEYEPLLSQTPVESSAKLAPAVVYYDSFDVQGGAVLGIGAVYRFNHGSAIQCADIEYYVSSSLYTSVELEQLWPVAINGKTETLVWRCDLVSTANVAYLHGTERLASGMIMLQDVKQGINAFRAEFK